MDGIIQSLGLLKFRMTEVKVLGEQSIVETTMTT